MAYDFEKMTILVADDSTHMRHLVRGILLAFGCKSVKEAANGRDALTTLLSSKIDLLICDWNMEPVNGIELIKTIRNGKDFHNPFLPIIMLTGHTRHERVIQARDVGIDEFVAKPISAQSIYDHIKNIIDNPRPYVRSQSYFGPDRRRKQMPFQGEERRTIKPVFEKFPKQKELTEEEVKALTGENNKNNSDKT